MDESRPETGELRQRVLQLLEREREFGFDAIGRDPVLQEGGLGHGTLIRLLAHLDYGEREAFEHWRAIRAHRETLCQKLGRDPGLPVVVLDYFFNVRGELRSPKAIEISSWEATERSAITDGLTGLFNRSYFHTSLKVEAKRSRRYDLTFSLVMLDLDDFKRVNDAHGHVVGDEALATVAEVIRQNLREIDVPCRYGGEEFTVILPETDRVGAFIVTERIRADVESVFQQRTFGGRTLGLTTSGGLAIYPADSVSEDELLIRADQALYLSKHRGKNRISLHPQEKRRSVRYDARHQVVLRLREGTEPVVATNVSRNGALVESQVPLSVGTDLDVHIQSHAAKTGLVVRGRVVRLQEVNREEVRQYNLGIAFLAENEEESRRIERLTEEISSPHSPKRKDA